MGMEEGAVGMAAGVMAAAGDFMVVAVEVEVFGVVAAVVVFRGVAVRCGWEAARRFHPVGPSRLAGRFRLAGQLGRVLQFRRVARLARP